MPPDPDHSIQLGELLCDATHEILWASHADDVRRQQANTVLHCRVGPGRATYHRFDPRRQHHLITYGARMVAAKQHPEHAVGWLSSREIQQRRYFHGELSTLNLLAHTCCHEFAHLLQQVAGRRYRGSVHNRHFYRMLDDLHRQGGAEQVRAYLQDGARRQGLALSAAAFPPVVAAPVTLWQVGDRVSFGEPPQLKQGQVLKVNRKTCTVACASGTARYRVPMQMLRRLQSRQDDTC